MSKARLEAFSDGVFAILLTLLVLELRVPAIADHSSLGQYATAMMPLIPKLVSFALTFMMICIHWVSHHDFFRQLQRITIELVWLNNLFLLWLCFLPFPTALFGDHPTDQFPVLLYSVDSLLCALTFYAFRSYALHAQLFEDNVFAKAHGPKRSLPAISLYAFSALASFISVYLALACLFIVPFFYFIPSLIENYIRQRKAASRK